MSEQEEWAAPRREAWALGIEPGQRRRVDITRERGTTYKFLSPSENTRLRHFLSAWQTPWCWRAARKLLDENYARWQQAEGTLR